MSKFEKKFGKYAIKNLTLILILCYVLGYAIQMINPQSGFLYYLTLDPERILHGQVWRLITWVIVPPEELSIFTLIMLYFYFSIGTLMERTLGTYQYNVYIFRGIFLTIIASFICYGLVLLAPGFFLGGPVLNTAMAAFYGSLSFSTYYINIAIFMAFAICYPDMKVLFMFVVPIKVKWLGIFDLVLLIFDLIVANNLFTRFAILAALINILIFYLGVKNLSHLKPREVKRRNEYRQQIKKSSAVSKHKCAICGQTDESNPDLQFRFCSKCNGNYEYCQEHLFTHKHVE